MRVPRTAVVALVGVALSLALAGRAFSEPAATEPHQQAGPQRFPPPDFPEGYTLPRTTYPLPRAQWREGMDVAVLAVALAAAALLALKVRSRRGIWLLSVFSLGYFGFYRQGCICPIGSIQNVALALLDRGYALPATAVLIFVLPLVFALFFGRVFCAGVCPLGAMQDLVLVRPVRVPAWLEKALGVVPIAYLGLAVLFAATNALFVICRYDPFVAFFRLSGTVGMLLFGVAVLLLGMFVGRPYCRFLCPYRVLLGVASRFAWRHATITPDECIVCSLCEEACPFGAIHRPTPEAAREEAP